MPGRGPDVENSDRSIVDQIDDGSDWCAQQRRVGDVSQHPHGGHVNGESADAAARRIEPDARIGDHWLKVYSANSATEGIQRDTDLDDAVSAANLWCSHALWPINLLASKPGAKSRREPVVDDGIGNAKNPSRLILANALQFLLHAEFHAFGC